MTIPIALERPELRRPDLTSANGPAGKARVSQTVRQLARHIHRPVAVIRALAASGTVVRRMERHPPGQTPVPVLLPVVPKAAVEGPR